MPGHLVSAQQQQQHAPCPRILSTATAGQKSTRDLGQPTENNSKPKLALELYTPTQRTPFTVGPSRAPVMTTCDTSDLRLGLKLQDRRQHGNTHISILNPKEFDATGTAKPHQQVRKADMSQSLACGRLLGVCVFVCKPQPDASSRTSCLCVQLAPSQAGPLTSDAGRCLCW